MSNGKLRVLVACEHSGVVREAFAAHDHDAWSCDLLPSLVPGKHIQGDVSLYLDDGWDLMIAHPPCTYLANVGAGHWKREGWAEKQKLAADFFMRLYNAPIPRVVVENPRGVMGRWFRKADQEVHPYFFGDPQLKRTCLWLRGLPALFWSLPGELFSPSAVARPAPTMIDASGQKRYWTDSAVRDPLVRSRTFPALAAAYAAQWG